MAFCCKAGQAADEFHDVIPLWPRQVVGRTVQELLQKYNQNPASPTVGIVTLSGLLHSEEKTAFREIARQLCT